jgi:endo-1,3(4)-beta-glucanase
MKIAMEPFIVGTSQNPLKYDLTWGGIVGSRGLNGDRLADFGSSYYNDHHYHWGYFIQAAAIIARFDPAWASQHRAWVEALIRDVSNPSSDDPYFTTWRSFDWYCGHSWSQGLFESADGKDQESTSEEINYHYGVMLWGIAVGSLQLEQLGRLMTSVATRSIQTYFLMERDNNAHPPNFIGNKVTGIFFENKADYTTWFGNNVEFIHGIQMLPITAMSEYVRTPKFVAEEWRLLEQTAYSINSGWKSVLWMNYAIVDPDAAFCQLESAPLDDGLTRTWALFWAATQAS